MCTTGKAKAAHFLSPVPHLGRLVGLLVLGLLLGAPAFSQVQDFPAAGYATPVAAVNQAKNRQLTQLIRYDSLGYFFDDFSRSKNGRPDTNLWLDGSGTYINNHLAVDPPTKNVATFDGLNTRGVPYNTLASASAPLDTLTSQPIELMVPASQVNRTFLSFYWQAGGHSPAVEPDPQDSLVLQFKGPDGVWRSVWRQVGNDATTAFAFASIQVPQVNQFSGFQFRFVAHGSRQGSFDLWHIDLVRLREDRTATDENFDDLALSQAPVVPFAPYTAMPWQHYNTDPIRFLSDTLKVRLKNFNNLGLPPTAPPRSIIAIDASAGLVDESNNQTSFDIPRTAFTNIGTPFTILEDQRDLEILTGLATGGQTLTVGGPVDLSVEYRLNKFIAGNSFSGNDTLRQRAVLNDYYAYDDGSAELIRQVGGNNARVAMAFDNAVGDSLYGIQMLFPPTPQYVLGSNPPSQPPTFVLMVFYELGSAATRYRDSLYYRETVSTVLATDRDRFQTFRLRKPVYIPAGRFWVGYQQGLGANNTVKVGCDVQANARGRMFYNSLGDWESYTGDPYALMIRPLFGTATLVSPTRPTAEWTTRVYPNPGREQLTIDGPATSVAIYDLAGREQLAQALTPGNSHQVNTAALAPGLYLVRVTQGNGATRSMKWVRE